MQAISGLPAGQRLVLHGGRDDHGPHRPQRRGQDHDAQIHAPSGAPGRRADHDLRTGYGHGRARHPVAHRLRLRRRVILPAQAPAGADGRDEGLLSRLGRRTLRAARPAVFAGRAQARVRAVRGHEGQIPAGCCDVAQGGAADSRRADVRPRPRLARRAAGHVPDALRAGGRVDPLLHAHHVRPRCLCRHDHLHPVWPCRRQRKEAGADRRVSVRTGAGRRLRRGTARKAHRRAQPQGRAGRAHPRGDAGLAAGLAVSPANLEQIMVHLDREAEA